MQPTLIAPTTLLHDRPFTNPAYNHADLSVINEILHRLCLMMQNRYCFTHSFRLELSETDGRSNRVIVTDCDALLESNSLTIVGFFGQKRPDADPKPLNEADEAMIEQFQYYPGLLSYNTFHVYNQPDNYGNVVIFRSEADKVAWSGNTNI